MEYQMEYEKTIVWLYKLDGNNEFKTALLLYFFLQKYY